jgi:hypothetical protein
LTDGLIVPDHSEHFRFEVFIVLLALLEGCFRVRGLIQFSKEAVSVFLGFSDILMKGVWIDIVPGGVIKKRGVHQNVGKT